MSLNFKSFIKIKFLLVIFIPTFLLFFGIIIYMPKDKNAQAAYILNPDNRDIVTIRDRCSDRPLVDRDHRHLLSRGQHPGGRQQGSGAAGRGDARRGRGLLQSVECDQDCDSPRL